MRLLFGLAMVFYTVTAAAMPVARLLAPPQATQIDFVPADEGMELLHIPPQAKTSIPRIHILDSNGRKLGHCTGSSVSDGGTVVTAGHCVEQCLKEAGAILRQEDLGVIDRTKMSEIKCPIEINGTTYQAKVLATNDCRDGDEMKSGNSKIHCTGLDFAVLQVPSTAPMACMSMAQKTPLPGAVVGSAGYLAQNTYRADNRAGARDGKAGELSFSIGETLKFQNTCNYILDKPKSKNGLQPGDMRLGTPEFGALMAPRVENGVLIQTTAETLPGVSGGPLINPANGEVIGFAVRNRMSNALYECRGGNFFSSTQGILDYMSREFPSLDQNELFNCKRNAIGKTWPGRSYNPEKPTDPGGPRPGTSSH